MSPRCLLLASSTSYRTEAFVDAAHRLHAEVVVASNRCPELAELYSDEAHAARGGYAGSIAVDFRDLDAATRRITDAARAHAFDAIVATDDLTAVIAALAARALGLPGNDPAAVETARNKALLRDRLRGAGLPCPAFVVAPVDDDGGDGAWLEALVREVEASGVGFPCVAKPLLLSASRGVIRADSPAELAAAVARIAAILRTRAEHADGLADARRVLVESFLPGAEVAVEGLLWPRAAGRPAELQTLALFDKPDPLDGPFFEETIYVTPSRHPPEVQRAIVDAVEAAAHALGLVVGPIHAELRLTSDGPVVIELAARSIGGLCARTLRFALGGDGGHALEELVLRQALGHHGQRASAEVGGAAAGVMMLPIPRAGVLLSVEGVEEARLVPLIEDVVLTVRPGERLIPLPEGASYPGFVFARGPTLALVEAALRQAHARLRFEVAPLIQ